MSQVTDPVLLDSTGQNIVTGISAVVSAIQSRGMPSPSASNPQMDGTASPGSSNDYARGDHVHPVDTSRASASAVVSLNNRYTDNTLWISNSDANDYKTSGMYAMATGNANIPAAWGILFVIAPRNDTIEQEYRCSGNIWNREFRSNTWSAWTQAVKQSQLAYVETGTTASRTYAVGEYFCWNGLLYRAKTAISSGASFTPGTNCEQVTDGGLNKIRSTDIPDEINSRFGYLRCVSKANNTNSGVTLTFDLNGNGVGIMFVQAAGTEGAIYGLTVLDSVTATRLVGSYSPTMNGANPRSFSINVGPWANVTIICTRSGWTA